MNYVTDSKFNRLLTDLNESRDVGRSTIVFTQFADTLEDLRERLSGAYRYQMATFYRRRRQDFFENSTAGSTSRSATSSKKFVHGASPSYWPRMPPAKD